MRWSVKEVWISKWNAKIQMPSLSKSISIIEKKEWQAEKTLERLCVGETKSHSIGETRG